MKKLLFLFTCIPLFCSAEQEAFLNPPEHVGAPHATAHAIDNRAVTMVSSMAVTPGERLWTTWYTGPTPGENQNNYVALATSGDGGKTWKEVLVVDPDFAGPVRAFDPEIWMAPDGNLYWVWAQAKGHDGRVAGVWAIKITNPEEESPEYEQPVRWTDGVMMCKPIVLSTGEWALPVSTWRKTDFSARMVVSTDQGKTWTVRGAANVPVKDRKFDEHMIVERKDGSLWLLCRTSYGIGESVSLDRGETWSEVAPSKIVHTSSRFYIHRLQSGNLLLVKHGYISEKTGRSHLRAFISTDDGETWKGGLLLDERKLISYPDGQQAEDGTIYITYDYSRTDAREILFASFREEDAAKGEDISGDVKLRQLISKGISKVSNDKEDTGEQNIKRDNNDDGVVLDKSSNGLLLESHKPVPLKVGAKIFADRTYMLAESPDALKGFLFLQVSLEGNKNYVCSQEGMLYFLTPRSERNSDSQEVRLVKQGFKKVALPEVQLFSKKQSNLCTLYQKHCISGETIHFGKWAVPLFAPTAE